jgi:PAS domain S-box-containing protein
MTLALTWWSFSYALYWLRLAPQGFFWLDATYFGVVIVPPAFLAFTLQFIGRGAWLTRRRMLFLSILPISTLLLLWTDPWHGLFFGERPDTLGTILSGNVRFYVNIAYSYLLVLISLFLLIRSYRRSRGIYRFQIVAIVIGTLIPLAGNVISLSGGSPFPDLDLTPLLFTASAIVFTYALYQLGLLDIVPIARDALVEQMGDGVIVLDAQMRVIDANPAAHHFLGLDGDRIIGQPAEKLLATHPEMRKLLQANSATTEMHMISNGQTLDIRSVLLSDRNENFNGRLVVMRDVSARVRVEQVLREVNRDLEKKIAEIEVLQTQLREQAIRDPLTGLFNRRFLLYLISMLFCELFRYCVFVCV